jgi:lipid-A-disaccharide synthase
MANRVVVPEFIQHQARPVAVAEALGRLLDDPAARAAMAASFDGIIASLGEGDASRPAARAIVEELAAKSD